ncbi:hypothetical protein BASA81_009719 [Batrachochytrium salamandrivorans]|nr:hypothetical protein BASA81_009719 [Batrachochytrium salamandrivorans]
MPKSADQAAMEKSKVTFVFGGPVSSHKISHSASIQHIVRLLLCLLDVMWSKTGKLICFFKLKLRQASSKWKIIIQYLRPLKHMSAENAIKALSEALTRDNVSSQEFAQDHVFWSTLFCEGDLELSSSWQISCQLRQLIYAILGDGTEMTVIEHIRSGHGMIECPVVSSKLSDPISQLGIVSMAAWKRLFLSMVADTTDQGFDVCAVCVDMSFSQQLLVVALRYAIRKRHGTDTSVGNHELNAWAGMLQCDIPFADTKAEDCICLLEAAVWVTVSSMCGAVAEGSNSRPDSIDSASTGC